MKATALLREKWTSYKGHPGSAILFLLIILAALISVAVVVFIIAYILIRGIPNLHLSLFSWTYTAENVSMMPAILNTLYMTVLTLIIAIPIGVGAAIYLTEYARPGSRLVKVIRVTNETLAGIPSIVYGLFGFLAFVIAMHMDYSVLAGVLTLSIMFFR